MLLCEHFCASCQVVKDSGSLVTSPQKDKKTQTMKKAETNQEGADKNIKDMNQAHWDFATLTHLKFMYVYRVFIW